MTNKTSGGKLMLMTGGRKLLKKRMKTHANMVANITKSDFQNGGRWLRSVSGP